MATTESHGLAWSLYWISRARGLAWRRSRGSVRLHEELQQAWSELDQPSLFLSQGHYWALMEWMPTRKRFFFTHPFNKACYLNLYSLETCTVPQITHIPPSVLTNAMPSGTAWEQGVNMHFCVGVILSAFPTLSLLTLVIGVFKHLHTLLCFSHLQPTWCFLLCFVSYGAIGDGGFPSTQCLFLI